MSWLFSHKSLTTKGISAILFFYTKGSIFLFPQGLLLTILWIYQEGGKLH